MNTLKKLTALFLTLILVLSVAACTQNPEPTQQGTEPAPTGTGELPGTGGIPDVDLNGFELILGDWWSPAVYEEKDPTTAWEQMVQDYNHEIEEKMNFTFQEIGLQNRGDYDEVLINSFIADDPVCNVFYGHPESVIPMAAQGLLYDLSTLDAFDFENDSKWSQSVIEYFTIHGKIYAARPSEDQPRLGILFNKRLLEEAGVDPDLPYDLQAAGQWDWEHFEELCQKLSKDTDNDGITDIYAMGGNDVELMTVGIYGNGAKFVDRDENGLFVDGTLNPAFEEGLNWSVSLIQKGYCREIGAGDAWDKAYTDFANAQTAMLCSQTWVIETYLSGMSDKFGYVMLPAGPKGHNCTPMYPTPICIPSCLDEETANNVALIINTRFDNNKNIEGAREMGVTFRDDYYNIFSDSRAVDETVTSMVTDPACQVYDSYYLIPNYEYYGYTVAVAAQTATAAEKIEELRPTNQAAIEAANAMFGN